MLFNIFNDIFNVLSKYIVNVSIIYVKCIGFMLNCSVYVYGISIVCSEFRGVYFKYSRRCLIIFECF